MFTRSFKEPTIKCSFILTKSMITIALPKDFLVLSAFAFSNIFSLGFTSTYYNLILALVMFKVFLQPLKEHIYYNNISLFMGLRYERI